MRIQRKVGLNVRRLRLKRDVSQSALALEAGVALNYVSGIECGRKNPTIDIIARLAEALRVGEADLFATVADKTLPRKRRGKNVHHQGRKARTR